MRRAAFHTLGCKVNSYETEAMQELLEQAGCEDAAYPWSDAPVETIEAIIEVVQLPEDQAADSAASDISSAMEEFKNEDNWPNVAELVNLRGDETTVYLLADGR